jgi:hypothetical protein
MDRHFGGVIWTNHALGRLKDRGISQGDAWATFNRPEQSRYAKAKAAWVYYRTYGNQRIEVVAKKNEKGQWIILSVWSRTVFAKAPYSNKEKSQPIWKLMIRQILGR